MRFSCLSCSRCQGLRPSHAPNARSSSLSNALILLPSTWIAASVVLQFQWPWTTAVATTTTSLPSGLVNEGPFMREPLRPPRDFGRRVPSKFDSTHQVFHKLIQILVFSLSSVQQFQPCGCCHVVAQWPVGSLSSSFHGCLSMYDMGCTVPNRRLNFFRLL
jgi:hypothetical protein